MIQSQLNRAVARATGDDCGVISRRGFSLVEVEAPLTDEDLDALILDWDNVQAEYSDALLHHAAHSKITVKRLPTVRRTKVHAKRTSRRTGIRRGTEAAH